MNKELLLKTVSNGIEPNHLWILYLVATDKELDELWDNMKIRSWREALVRKGFINEISGNFYLTDRGSDVYAACKGDIKEIEEVDIPENPIKQIATEIKEEVDKKILEKTGSKKLINPSGKPFNASVRELESRLLGFAKKFKNTDYDKMKKAILSYTDDVLDGKITKPRTLYYFIWKDDNNRGLISEMEGYMEIVEEKKIIDTRQLF